MQNNFSTTHSSLQESRKTLDRINSQMLELLVARFEIIQKVFDDKNKAELPFYDPERETECFKKLLEINQGRLNEKILLKFFKELFSLSRHHQENLQVQQLKIKTSWKLANFSIKEKNIFDSPLIIAGPCSIESSEQMLSTANFLKKFPHVKVMRGGAFKPRTSPYAFQGLGAEAFPLLQESCEKNSFLSISEVMSPSHVNEFGELIDIFQVGSRNMDNYDLLKEIGKSNKPVMLKRGYMATYEEFLLAAEYIAKEGNNNIIFCERGIRTYNTKTRNTLDLSIVPLLKQETQLPIIVDLSHGTGRKDIIAALAKASFACGADGLMVEVHPHPELALSDRKQQLSFDEFENFYNEVFYEIH